jgi:hypothetical protein
VNVKQRLPIVVFTAAVFGAGYGAHRWIASEPGVPPPPTTIGSEFTHGPGASTGTTAANTANGAKAGARKEGDQPFDRTKLLSEIQKFSEQIKTYQKRLEELDAEFYRALDPLLTEPQRAKFVAMQKRWAERRAKGMAAIAAETAPLSDEQIFRLQRNPLMSVLSSVSLTMRYDSYNKELKFDEAQATKVRDLLRVRRDKFLDLIDSTPPPSITLSQLALHLDRIGAEPEKPKPAK